MRILHVITTLETGGAEKLMVDVLPRLKQLGHDVDLAVLKWRHTPFYEQLEAAGVRIIGFSQRESVYSPLHIFRLWRLMRHYDIVHSHNFASQLFAAIASVVCSVRTMDVSSLSQNYLHQRLHRIKSQAAYL